VTPDRRPDVSVVIPHAGNLEYLDRCLTTVTAEPAVCEVILVTPELPNSLAIAKANARVRCAITTERLSYGRAANHGAADAQGTFVFVLNDDTVIPPGAIDSMSDFLSANADVAACAPPLVFPDGRPQPSAFADVGFMSAIEVASAPLLRGPFSRIRRHPYSTFPSSPTDVDWLSGAALMVRKSDFDLVGGFDLGFNHGLEDADLCRRFRQLGRRVVAVPGPAVVHAKGGSGYRSGNADSVRHALLGGMTGWAHYARRYHGPLRRRLQQGALLMFVWSRIVFLTVRSRLGHPAGDELASSYRAAATQILDDAW
jgi:GT2 family glycosyltransferase